MEEKYSDEEIEFIDGLESVRRRAPMYLGRLDAPELPTRLLMQALCHAIDSATDGRCTEISIEVSETVARVTYDAALPLERMPAGSTAAEVMLTALHACSSMKKHVRIGDRYCSLGMAVLTAVSHEMIAEIVEGERACTIELARGRLRNPIAITRLVAPTGALTRLSFRLDEELLHDNVKFDASRIRAVCREILDDVGGVRIEVRAVGEMESEERSGPLLGGRLRATLGVSGGQCDCDERRFQFARSRTVHTCRVPRGSCGWGVSSPCRPRRSRWLRSRCSPGWFS